uniref:Uncharacterized protein n=1 Tax=Rousettus aegyptiacus TaxID=9407 RepID=A0A7J8GBA0_ROUAE|nr:hypothetical protein HJG63_011669 [Rousettus aegyptiacus]
MGVRLKHPCTVETKTDRLHEKGKKTGLTLAHYPSPRRAQHHRERYPRASGSFNGKTVTATSSSPRIVDCFRSSHSGLIPWELQGSLQGWTTGNLLEKREGRGLQHLALRFDQLNFYLQSPGYSPDQLLCSSVDPSDGTV